MRMRGRLVALMVLVAAVLPARSAPDMSRPPAVGEIKPYRTPRRIRWKLPNGLEVLLVEDSRLPMVTARLAIRSGAAAVSAEEAGLAEAMAELLGEGTARLSAKAVSDAAEEYGGDIESAAGPDSVVIETHCLSEYFDRMMALLAGVARRPSFPKKEVKLRKANMLSELELSRGESDFLASVAFYKKIYRSHPYAVTAPTEDSIARIDRRKIVALHKRLFVPRNATLVLVGDIGYGQVQRSLKRYFASWKGRRLPMEAPAVIGGHESRRVYLVDRPEAVQASVFMGNLAVREDHPDYFSMLLANQILGGSFSSRLVQDIREKKGYTYSIGTGIEHRLTSSLFRLRTPVRTEVAGAALKAIFKHLETIRDKKVSKSELQKAKSYLIGDFARSMETQAGLADALVHMKMQRLPEDFYDTYVERLRAVTVQGVLRSASTFIRPDEMTVVVVGRASSLESVLPQFTSSPVIVVDQNGD